MSNFMFNDDPMNGPPPGVDAELMDIFHQAGGLFPHSLPSSSPSGLEFGSSMFPEPSLTHNSNTPFDMDMNGSVMSLDSPHSHAVSSMQNELGSPVVKPEMSFMNISSSSAPHGYSHLSGSTPSISSSSRAQPSSKTTRKIRKPRKQSNRGIETALSASFDDSSSITSDGGKVMKASDIEKLPPEERERMKKRLARKAELARASRRRKKAFVQDLENKVKILGQKVEELQRKLQHAQNNNNNSQNGGNVNNSNSDNPFSHKERERANSQLNIRRRLAEMVEHPEQLDDKGQRELTFAIQKFVENSRARQASVDIYLEKATDALAPGLQVKFVLWGLDQNEDFYTQPGLWQSLMLKEVGVTEEQMIRIKAHREAIHQERQMLAHCEKSLRELRNNVQVHTTSLNRKMDALQSILSPWQLAKFYVWVEKNEWCMQMLNSMWSAQNLES